MPDAQVYVNWGRLVADCWCGDAREVETGQKTMTCCVGNGCPGHTSTLVWAAEMPSVMAALNERPAERRRNWFPKGHPLAVSAGYPHGQTGAELRAEAAAGEQRDAQAIAARRAQLLAELRALDTDENPIGEIRRKV